MRIVDGDNMAMPLPGRDHMSVAVEMVLSERIRGFFEAMAHNTHKPIRATWNLALHAVVHAFATRELAAPTAELPARPRVRAPVPMKHWSEDADEQDWSEGEAERREGGKTPRCPQQEKSNTNWQIVDGCVRYQSTCQNETDDFLGTWRKGRLSACTPQFSTSTVTTDVHLPPHSCFTCPQPCHTYLIILPSHMRWLKMCPLLKRSHPHERGRLSPYPADMVAECGEDAVDAAGGPAESHSGSIVETLEDLKAKAELQMAEARQTEATASHNFQMRQQFLEDELKFNAQDLEAAKHSAGEAQFQLTTDTADLKMTEDALAEDTAALEDTTRDCQAKAVEFETATNGRSEELDAHAKARAVISQKTGGDESFSYGLTQTSFLQLSRSVLSSQGVNTHVQHVVDTVKVEKPEIIKQTEQKSIIQEKTRHVEIPVLQIVKKTVEIPGTLLQFTDKVVDIPVVVQRQIPIVVRTVQKTTDIPQLQCIDKVIDVPVGLVAQVPRVRVVAETAEISQLACETCVKDNMFMIAGEINVAGKCHHETVVRGIAQNLSSVGSKWLNRGNMQQQQHQDKQPRAARQSTRQEREKERGERGQREEGEKGQEERESVRKVERGKKEDDEEEECKQVKMDVTGWTAVTRHKRQRRMIQIFVKVDEGKVTPMEVSLTDGKIEDVMRQVQRDEDVYVTMHGRVLKRNEKLKSCGVTDGCTIQVTSRMRGGGKAQGQKEQRGEETSREPEETGADVRSTTEERHRSSDAEVRQGGTYPAVGTGVRQGGSDPDVGRK